MKNSIGLNDPGLYIMELNTSKKTHSLKLRLIINIKMGYIKYGCGALLV